MFHVIEHNLQILESDQSTFKHKLDACKIIENNIDKINITLNKQHKAKPKERITINNIDDTIQNIRDDIDTIKDINGIDDIEKFMALKHKIIECKKFIDSSNDLKILTVDDNGGLDDITHKIRDHLLIEQIE